MLEDLKKAERYIFMEYFIVEEGHFWNSILDVLKEKAAEGVEVRVLYDDVGCMLTLPGYYYKTLPSIFLADFELNRKSEVPSFAPYFWNVPSVENTGYVVPFGDGPGPIFKHRVAKIMLMNMLNQAQNYVYMMSPYLIIDNELCQCMENAATRGIDVRIVTPHIPDKKIVFWMTQSHYKRLMDAGVKIYEYEPGFVHAKVYISDAVKKKIKKYRFPIV